MVQNRAILTTADQYK